MCDKKKKAEVVAQTSVIENSKSDVREMAEKAHTASQLLAKVSSKERNLALVAMADALELYTDEILQANALDLDKARQDGMAKPLQDRLLLTKERLADIANALRELMAQSDPIGEIIEGRTLESGIKLSRVRVPMGVVAMIYEARPNVTADAAGLCIKTANACILRGGSAANHTNIVMTEVLANAASSAGLPPNCIQQVQTTSRDATLELMGMRDLVDVLIPRGGRGLIQSCVQNSKVPVIETGTGNCHIYIAKDADLDMAESIVINAKTQRPGVCNAAESLLVDECVAAQVLPRVLGSLTQRGVLIHADEPSLKIARDAGCIEPDKLVLATEDDWGSEYLELEISVKLVSGLDEAIAHINKYGTRHSEAIVTENYESAIRFTNEVDASSVYVNASTRFTDGGMFGLGAEIGISTQKLHARGPMGLSALTTSKYVLMGSGQVR